MFTCRDFGSKKTDKKNTAEDDESDDSGGECHFRRIKFIHFLQSLRSEEDIMHHLKMRGQLCAIKYNSGESTLDLIGLNHLDNGNVTNKAMAK